MCGHLDIYKPSVKNYVIKPPRKVVFTLVKTWGRFKQVTQNIPNFVGSNKTMAKYYDIGTPRAVLIISAKKVHSL